MKIIERLKTKFHISDLIEKREDLAFFTAEKKDAESILMYLKEFEGYSHLTFINAVDWIEEDKFQITYLLGNYKENHNLGLRIFIDRKIPEMISVHNLWKHAWQFQREMKELFGINFPDSPRLNEPFVLEGWEDIPPMRRDFDTKEYSDKTYFPRKGRKSYDPKTYMKEKLYPEFVKTKGE